MTKLTIKGRNLEITDSIKDYISGQFNRFDKYNKHIKGIEAELIIEKNPSVSNNQIIEVNIQANKAMIRAEAATPDMYASIDSVIDKLERQMEKYEDLRFRNRKSKFSKAENSETDLFNEEEELEISTY